MIVQIFGTKKCRDTGKAIRFFKERRIPTQFIDLLEKDISPGEFNSILRYLSPEELIDREGKQFKKRQMDYMKFDVEEELREDPLLMKTPIVRSSKGVTVGHEPDIWKSWLND